MAYWDIDKCCINSLTDTEAQVLNDIARRKASSEGGRPSGEEFLLAAVPGTRALLPPIYGLETLILLIYEPQNTSAFYAELRRASMRIDNTNRYYHSFGIPKRDGSVRRVYEVMPQLLMMQRFIKRSILDSLDDKFRSQSSFAYHKGISVRDNAMVHAGAEKIVKMDIKDFFDRTSISKIHAVFARYTPYNKDVRTILSKIVCVNGHLVQGAPTSPQLSNLVLYDFDRRIELYCRALNINYTRYCDDLTFSGGSDMDHKKLIDFVTSELSVEKYRPNHRKTRVFGPSKRHIVTGVVCNNDRIRVEPDLRRRLRQEVYYICKFGIEKHRLNRSDEPVSLEFNDNIFYINSLIGKINYALHIDPDDRSLLRSKERLLGYEEKYLKNISRRYAWKLQHSFIEEDLPFGE